MPERISRYLLSLANSTAHSLAVKLITTSFLYHACQDVRQMHSLPLDKLFLFIFNGFLRRYLYDLASLLNVKITQFKKFSFSEKRKTIFQRDRK